METKVIKTSEITDSVLARIDSMKKNGGLSIPSGYSPENALKSAYLILSEQVDSNKKPVLESCSQASIANALLDMVVQGLNPMKKQCYFIPYAGKLQLSRSYEGSVAISKRIGLKSIVANVIYEGDAFEYAIDLSTGKRKVSKHEQSFENIDITKIRGAYAISVMDDGSIDTEIMNIAQIRKAWLQGAAKGDSGAHKNFTDEMCKKTVINRACKSIIGQSDDAYLYDDKEVDEVREHEPKAGKEELNIEEAEVVELTPVSEQSTEQPQPTAQSQGQMEFPEKI